MEKRSKEKDKLGFGGVFVSILYAKFDLSLNS